MSLKQFFNATSCIIFIPLVKKFVNLSFVILKNYILSKKYVLSIFKCCRLENYHLIYIIWCCLGNNEVYNLGFLKQFEKNDNILNSLSQQDRRCPCTLTICYCGWLIGYVYSKVLCFSCVVPVWSMNFSNWTWSFAVEDKFKNDLYLLFFVNNLWNFQNALTTNEWFTAFFNFKYLQFLSLRTKYLP